MSYNPDTAWFVDTPRGTARLDLYYGMDTPPAVLAALLKGYGAGNLRGFEPHCVADVGCIGFECPPDLAVQDMVFGQTDDNGNIVGYAVIDPASGGYTGAIYPGNAPVCYRGNWLYYAPGFVMPQTSLLLHPLLNNAQLIAAARQLGAGFLWPLHDYTIGQWQTDQWQHAEGEERLDALALAWQSLLVAQGLNPLDPLWVQAWNIMQKSQDWAMKSNADASHGFVNLLEALPILAAPLMAFFAAEILPGLLASFAPAEGFATAETLATATAELAPSAPGASEIFQVAKTFGNVAAAGNPQLKGALSLVGGTVSFGTSLVGVVGVADLAGGAVGVTDAAGNVYALDAAGTSAISAVDPSGATIPVPTGVPAMPLGQDFTTYPDVMGMDTGNLGLDVPIVDPGLDPLAGTPIETIVPEPGPDLGTVAAVGPFQPAPYATYSIFDANTGQYSIYDYETGELLNTMGPDGTLYDGAGNVLASGPDAAAAGQAAVQGGFNVNDLLKLMQGGLSIYAAVQQLEMQKARAATSGAAAQTRTARDPRTGQLVTQRFNPTTGQWQSVGPAGAAGAPGAGLSQPIGGIPLWGWLAGGGLLLLALSKDKRR